MTKRTRLGRLLPVLCLCSLLLFAGCGKKQEANAPAKTEPSATTSPAPAQPAQEASAAASQDDPPAPNAMMLPLNFDKHTGDLDEMVKRRTIRAIVMVNPVSFFYEQGQPKGVMYEAMEEFQRFV